MVDDISQYGLGALESPPDDRDWDISTLYATAGVPAPDPATLGSAFRCADPFPPVPSQGNTPRCTAFSNGSQQQYADLRDVPLAAPDYDAFFALEGGTANGAIPRNALNVRLNHGYPVVGHPEQAAAHRIAAYYAVPVLADAIKSALVSFGPVLFSSVWYNSWFRPSTSASTGVAVLPAPDFVVGRHEFMVDGYNATGFEIFNSWGPGWGVGGRATLSYAYLAGNVSEVWRAQDRLDLVPPTPVPPKPLAYGLHFAPHASVQWVSFWTKTTPRKIGGWSPVQHWGASASSAPCGKPFVAKGATSGQATVAKVTAGVFANRYVHIYDGVTVYSR